MTNVLPGARVVRIEWMPGTDLLVGTCHCTAQHEATDPVAMWTWLLAHPDGHVPAPGPAGPTLEQQLEGVPA